MKIPPKASDARQIAHQVLWRVERDNGYANIILDKLLRRHSIPPQEAALATEITLGTLRQSIYIDFLLNQFLVQPITALPLPVRAALRIGVYELLYLRVPAYASVDQAMRLLSDVRKSLRGVVNGVLRKFVRQQEAGKTLPQPSAVLDNARQALAIANSHPTWLLPWMENDFSTQQLQQWMQTNNTAPSITLRVNPLKTTTEKFIQNLQDHDFTTQTSPHHPQVVEIVKSGGGNIDQWPGFAAGEFAVQDIGAQLVGWLCAPKPASVILDICAAPGGKTCQMAEMTNNQAHIIAIDIHPGRCRLIDKNVQRLALKNIKICQGDAQKPGQLLNILQQQEYDSADLVLIDAPCSGLGTLRQHPEIKLRPAPNLKQLTKQQDALLDQAASVLKPGGALVYSVCTITPQEGRERIAAFLKRHQDFTLDTFNAPQPFNIAWLEEGPALIETWRHEPLWDGFFAARLIKTELT